MDVEFSVDLIKKNKINWPRLENQDYIMVRGSSRALNEALQHATTELMRLMELRIRRTGPASPGNGI
jgi:acetamidase/formamidase